MLRDCLVQSIIVYSSKKSNSMLGFLRHNLRSCSEETIANAIAIFIEKTTFTSLKPFGLLQSYLLCVNMVSVTSASRYITSASRYHPRCQSRSFTYIRGLIPRNFAELAEAVPIEDNCIQNFIWGVISSDVRSEIYFYGDALAVP